MIQYSVRARNFAGNMFTSNYDTLHDAEVSVLAIKEANYHLQDDYKFHGYVIRLDKVNIDGYEVTNNAEPIYNLSF